MRVPGCGECQRLWEEYTDTTFALVKLDTQVKMATLRYESLEVMALLKEGVEAATHRRNAALARLKQHEATDQTRSSSRVLEFKIPQRPAAGTLTKTWNKICIADRINRAGPPLRLV